MPDEFGGDCIGGFPVVSPNCAGCGKPLLLENAWMTDGCPCNTPLGVNSMNETRWRLLQQLQQQQARELEKLRRPANPEHSPGQRIADAVERYVNSWANSASPVAPPSAKAALAREIDEALKQ